MNWHKKWSLFAVQPCSLYGQTVPTIIGTFLPDGNFYKYLPTLARTDLLYMLNWGTQWTMVSYLKKKKNM